MPLVTQAENLSKYYRLGIIGRVGNLLEVGTGCHPSSPGARTPIIVLLPPASGLH